MSVTDPVGTVRRVTEPGYYHGIVLVRTAATDYPWVNIASTWTADRDDDEDPYAYAEQYEAFTDEALPDSEIIGVMPGFDAPAVVESTHDDGEG